MKDFKSLTLEEQKGLFNSFCANPIVTESGWETKLQETVMQKFKDITHGRYILDKTEIKKIMYQSLLETCIYENEENSFKKFLLTQGVFIGDEK